MRAVRHAHEFEQVLDTLVEPLAPKAEQRAVEAQELRTVEVVVEIGSVGDIADARLVAGASERQAKDLTRASGREEQAEQELQRCCLPSAVRPDESEDDAFGYVEGQVPYADVGAADTDTVYFGEPLSSNRRADRDPPPTAALRGELAPSKSPPGSRHIIGNAGVSAKCSLTIEKGVGSNGADASACHSGSQHLLSGHAARASGGFAARLFLFGLGLLGVLDHHAACFRVVGLHELAVGEHLPFIRVCVVAKLPQRFGGLFAHLHR